MAVAAALPPGQRPIDAFPRWGLPRFVRQRPTLPPHPRLWLGGAVERPQDVGLEVLETVPRCEQVSNLHCVTTWTRCDLDWSGWRLRDVYEQLVVPRARPRGDVRFLVFRGLDGYRTRLPLDDALAADVLLADRRKNSA